MLKFKTTLATLGVALMAFSPASEIVQIAKNNNAFAFDLFQKLNEKESGNIFFSPFSISTALAMTYAGADKMTASQMAKTLHFGENSPLFHQAFRDYINALNNNAEGTIQLNIANKIWGEKSFKLNSNFLELTRKAYKSPLEQVDFLNAPDSERMRINSWIEQQTKGKIRDLIPSGAITPLTRLVLTNAIYFKADWKFEFDTTQTYDQDFRLSDSEQKKTPFMHKTSNFQYAEVAAGKFLKLDYKGEKHSMVLALPNTDAQMAEMEKHISKSGLDQIFSAIQEKVYLALPKFKLTKPVALKDYLSDMGMPQAFTGAADFSKMMEVNPNPKVDEGRLYISEVLHKAFIEIDEKGTEAAAATAVIMAVTTTAVSDHYSMPKTFVADHPFLFYIVDNETGAILFMGKLMNPEVN